MDFNYLPQEPEKRRVVMVLPNYELERLRYESGGSELLLNRQVSLLDASVTESSPLVENLRSSGLLNPGSILIQSPYNSSNYADAVDASYIFAKEKCSHFATLCGLIAARKVFVEQMEIQTTEGRTKFSGNLDTAYGGGEIEGESLAWERMRKTIRLNRTYKEAQPNLDAARTYLRKHQWLTDAHMNDLLELREAGIPIDTEELTLSVTQESQKNLEVAFSVKVPVYADLQGKIERIKKESYQFTLTIMVEF